MKPQTDPASAPPVAGPTREQLRKRIDRLRYMKLPAGEGETRKAVWLDDVMAALDDDAWCETEAWDALTTEPCTVPPAGWSCSRSAGHDGPCAAVPATPTPPGVAGDGAGPGIATPDMSAQERAQIAAVDAMRDKVTALRLRLAETTARADRYQQITESYIGIGSIDDCTRHRDVALSQREIIGELRAALTDLRRQYEEARRLWANRVEAPTGKYPDLTDVPHYASWVRSMDAALAAAALHQGGTRDG